jgi:hypothetical protein
MSFFYIHGFATNLTHTFKPRKFEENELFPAILRIIPKSQFYPFLWGKDLALKWWQLVNLTHFSKLYWLERSMAADELLLERLKKELEQRKPKVILAHSMGCFLFLNYVQKFGAPDFVEKIVFFEADIDYNFKLPESLVAKIKSKQLKIYNYHCFWDDSLFMSSLLHFKFRAGNLGFKNPLVKNLHFALGKERGAFHNSPLESKRFSRSLARILGG